MSLPMTVWSWLKKQFSTHTVRSVAAVFLALALLVTGGLWAGGVFRAKEVEETFTYLPNRTYRVADPDPPEPETLGELLHADEPDVDILLRHPEIAQELLQAEVLTDIVDSRLALNNLRSLDRQLSERLGEAPDSLDMIDLAELRAHAGIGLDAVASEWDSTYRLLATTYSPGLSSGYFPGLVPAKAQEQQESLATAKSATSRLLKAADRNAITAIPANMNMKCVWQAPAEGLVHMVPSGAWLPELGYKLFRIVNGSSTLIAEQLAAPQDGLNGSLGLADDAWIKELYAQAALTPAKLTALGMDAAKFNEIAYKTDSLQPPARVSGALDFDKMREALITIPSGLEQRIPETDLLLRQPIYVMGRQDNTLISSAAIRSRVQQKFSVLSPQTSPLISAIKSEPGGDAKSELMQSILSARQQIATLSFVDDAFAEAAGFLIRDDLTSLQLPDGTKITYRVETPDGAQTSRSITAGTETGLSKPLGLNGYGIDGKVPLRWQQASAPAEKAILSGYWIERQLEGESTFTQINDEPVVVSYLLDETGVYFESPVFFEDTVDNGLNVTYRIRSLDVFGRTSEYSDPISFLVEKVTPPNAPAVDPPDLSTDLAASDAARQAIAANPGQLGIVLPIYTDSPDTVRFTIYRAVAHGAQSFGPPEVLANLTYHNPMPDAQPTFGVTSRELPQVEPVPKNNAKQLVRTNYVKAAPNLIYFDANVAEGYTYKYWVSAWDSWNNESAWSKSASAGVPSAVKPAVPGALSISMLSRELPDFSQEPPGILHDELVAKKDLSASAAGSVARVYATDIETVKSADQEGIAIGHFIPAAEKFSVIDMQYDNLPEDKYIHLFVAVRGEDVLPDGTARVRWPAYSGDGLGGYAVYVPEFPLQPLELMQQMSRAELVELGRWRQLNDQPVSENQFLAGGLSSTPGSFALFLICLVPEGAQPGQPADGVSGIGMLQGISNHFALMAEGGFVSIAWSAPDDPQIKHYRVYRSEVASFKKPVDESALVWTMVGDHIKAPKYTERVEQTFAHYYYYKVTSVTPWGVESAVGSVERFRVPATKPPQTPTLLLPLSRKDGIEINFSAVGHCSRYEVYRTEIPRPSEIQINQFTASHEAVAAALFETPSDKDTFFSGLITRSLKTPSAPITVTAPIRVIDKFKTMTTLNKTGIVGNLNSLNNTSALTAYKQVLASHGPLALADYTDLSIEMLHMINWTKVGELPVDEDTVEAVDPATGLLKPLSIIDMSAVYGKLYLYTVQAWNDDNLGSGRPEPVEATTRRNAPFDPIAGLKSDSLAGQPSLSWNPATMANLTWQQCREDTVGYIVYRSDTEDGEYLQASPLLLETKWTDGQADRYAFNWYKVKVLDTGGYLSEFSEPLLIRRLYMFALEPVIPPIERLQPETILPDIAVRGKSFTVQAGSVLQIPYELTGTEPIDVTLTAVNQKGVAARGIALDATTRSVRTSKDLPVGTYTLTLTAVNKTGEDSVTFTLEVTPKPTASPGPTTKPTPTPTPTTAPRPTVTPTSKPTPALVPPTVKLDKSSYTVYYPDSFTAKYTLQGSEPITLELKVYKADGSLADGFTLDTAARTIKAGTLRPGQYNGILTASNSVGKSEVRFALSVEMRTPPVLVDLENNVIEITHSVFPVRETTVSFTVSGTTPFTWSLRPIEKAIIYNRQWIQPAPVPADVKIDSSGKLTIRSTVAVGVYAFDVVVSNAVGSDFQTIILVVKTGLRTFGQADPLPTDSGYVFLSATPGATPTPEAVVTPAPQETFKSDRMSCLNFVLTQVELTRPVADETSLLAGRIGYAGSALLDLGYSEP
ncbi:MAG: hypothetical protein PHX81_09030, partial [Eubacteriales bacterium]|nr:hypothetical protein [Eubacteriales bacterium]